MPRHCVRLPLLNEELPSDQRPFAQSTVLQALGQRPVRRLGGRLPPRPRSYGRMRQTRSLPLSRALVAISQGHKAAGLPSPTSTAVVLEVMKGIRRKSA